MTSDQVEASASAGSSTEKSKGPYSGVDVHVPRLHHSTTASDSIFLRHYQLVESSGRSSKETCTVRASMVVDINEDDDLSIKIDLETTIDASKSEVWERMVTRPA
jgi:hypothetical protein